MRLLSRLLLLLLLVFPATVLLRSGPGGEARGVGGGSWPGRSQRQPSLKPEAAGDPGSVIRSAGLSPPLPRPPACSWGSQSAQGESPLGPPPLSRGARGSAGRPCLVAAHSLAFLCPGTAPAAVAGVGGSWAQGRRRVGSGHSCTPSAPQPLYFFWPPPLHPLRSGLTCL